MRNAAAYSDRWFKDERREIRMYYICLSGGTQWPCNTVIESKAWARLNEDMEAIGQRWYCPICKGRYKPKYGVLVELINSNFACYFRGEVPPYDIQDARMMHVEEDFKQFTTPQELLNALPNPKPLARGDFLTETSFEGCYTFNVEMMAGIEFIDWSQFYNMTSAKKKRPR